MPTLATEQRTLHYEEIGAGTPVVLVHGWSFSSAVLADEAAALAAGRRVVVPDLRGHGRSAPSLPHDLGALADDLAALVDALALERAVVLGWSLGAQVALAALPRLRPRVAGLALVAATPRFTAGEGWPHGLPAQGLEVLAHRLRRDPARAVARFADGMFAPGELDLEAEARWARLRAGVAPADPAALLAGLDVLARTDLRAALPAVDVPVLLVHGERDAVCPAGASRAMAALLPRARRVELPGLGHAPFVSRPEAFRAALLPFLAEAR